jgi:DNA polymerase III delta prime subunit
MLRKIRRIVDEGKGSKEDFGRLSFMIYGPSGSGKTALVKFMIRCILCKQFDATALNPCNGSCRACHDGPEEWGREGIETYNVLVGNEFPIHVSIVDCTRINTIAELEAKLVSLKEYPGLRISYFDEVHRLKSRSMDQMLLNAVQDKNDLWLFSTAKPELLEQMFLNRLIKLSTQLPEAKEFEPWLVDRCDERGINWEPEAIVRVGEKSKLIVGTALHALALASLDPATGLTLDLLENDWIVNIEE